KLGAGGCIAVTLLPAPTLPYSHENLNRNVPAFWLGSSAWSSTTSLFAVSIFTTRVGGLVLVSVIVSFALPTKLVKTRSSAPTLGLNAPEAIPSGDAPEFTGKAGSKEPLPLPNST